jgi:hypothetical protein
MYNTFKSVVARPEGVHNSFVDKPLDSLTDDEAARETAADPVMRANLPTGCRGRFKCLAEYLEWEARGSRFSAFEPARPDERVYFIGPDHGPVKIGLTTNVSQRLDHLQTGSPYELKVLAVVPAGRSLERAYHDSFDRHRLRGEWFERAPDILDEIRFWSQRAQRGTSKAQFRAHGGVA